MYLGISVVRYVGGDRVHDELVRSNSFIFLLYLDELVFGEEFVLYI